MHAASAKGPSMDFKLPELGEGVYEAEFVAWLVKPGEVVKSGQNLFEVLTDKATMEIPAPFAGTISALRAKPGQKVKIGDVMLTYAPAGSREDGAKRKEEEPKAVETPSKRETPTPPVPAPPSAPSHVKAAPSVRQLARKLGVDLSRVNGSGPEGRILVGDLTSQMQPAAAPAAKEPAQDFGRPGTRLALQGVRRLIAEKMVKSKRTIPHYSYVDECDVSALVALREQLKESFAAKGAKLTYLAFFVKAAAEALKEVPLVNASLDDERQEIVLHSRYDIGVAVAAPGGLTVPVVRGADRLDLLKVAGEIERLSQAARTGKARREELTGGTFTVTSIGGVGGLISTPIINHPEAGILGVGKVVKRPVYDEHGHIKPAHMLYLSLSFDHRVVDGAIGAAFGNALIRHLQKPATLLLPG